MAKFKVGDKVRRDGEVFEVVEWRNGEQGKTFYRLWRKNEPDCKIPEEELSPYVEPKFKVGDKVRSKGFNDVYEIVKVQERNSEYFYFGACVTEKSMAFGEHKESLLELYVEPKFKVGDKVQISGCGPIYEINAVNAKNIGHIYDMITLDKNSPRKMSIHVNHLVLYVEPKTAAVIKVGDKVRFNDGRHAAAIFNVVKKRQTWSETVEENEIMYWLIGGDHWQIARNDEIVKAEVAQ